MKNITEFEKLFKLNFPIENHFDYYVETLKKSIQFEDLDEKISDFESLENFIDSSEMHTSLKSYKLDYALPKLKNYIMNTKAYEKMIQHDFGGKKFISKDELRNNDDTYLISVDFNSANYHSVKFYDSDNEMKNGWTDLCEWMDIHPTLAKSKSFRQFVFGNTSPKFLQKTQHEKINHIVEMLIGEYGYEDNDFVFISHDELIVRLRPDHKLALDRIHHLLDSINEINVGMPIHHKVFKNDGIGKGMCVQTIYTVKMGGLSEKHKELFKTPGNKFYKYFKTHILEEELDRRDLMFKNDSEIAIWHTEDDSIADTMAPIGELSMEELEKNYLHFINLLKTEVRGLSDAQVRKIVNVTLSLCSMCKNSTKDCNCWTEI